MTSLQASGSLAHNTTNDTRLADWRAFVRECGANEAKGDDAMPGFAVGFVRAISDGIISPDKDTNGDDAAAREFKEYTKAKGKKAFHERSEGSQKAQCSKLRQLQKAASNPKFDFVDVLNRAVTIRQTAIDDGVEVKPAFAAYVDTAREQLKIDDELGDDVIFATVTKSESTREVTLEGQLKKAAKILEDIQTGEKWAGVRDQSQEVITATEQLNARIGQLAQLKATQEGIEKMLAAGYTLNDDGSLQAPIV